MLPPNPVGVHKPCGQGCALQMKGAHLEGPQGLPTALSQPPPYPGAALITELTSLHPRPSSSHSTTDSLHWALPQRSTTWPPPPSGLPLLPPCFPASLGDVLHPPAHSHQEPFRFAPTGSGHSKRMPLLRRGSRPLYPAYGPQSVPLPCCSEGWECLLGSLPEKEQGWDLNPGHGSSAQRPPLCPQAA